MFGQTQDPVSTKQQDSCSKDHSSVPEPSINAKAIKSELSTKYEKSSSCLVLKTDQSYRRTPEAAVNVSSIDFANPPPESDVFWDALDLVDNQETCLNFGLSTSSYEGSWSDSSHADLNTWSPNSSCLTAPDSTSGNLSIMLPEGLPGTNTSSTAHIPELSDVNFQVDAKDISLPVPHTCPLQQYPSLSYPQPSDTTSAQHMPASSLHNEQTLACSEDPFMGWANKRASQMFDEYNWVLSHVETL